MSKLFESMRRGTSTAIAKVKKYSPEILVVTGIGGLITATVMACKATVKADEIIAETRESLDNVHKCQDAEKDALNQDYTNEDARKDTMIIYAKAALKFAKLYGPAILLGSASVAAICQSHRIMRKRNLALASAYSTLDQSFKKYKERVAERFGEDVEKEIRYGLAAKEVEKIVEGKDGKEKKVKETIMVAGCPYEISPYAKFFDETCTNWTKDPDQNLMFLRQQEHWANNRFRARGYLTLNEIYEALGIPETNEGMTIGWVYRPGDSAYANYIDFGIYNIHRERNRAFVNGYERSILLDFNPDGNIYGQL